jgi:hypothetical protein
MINLSAPKKDETVFVQHETIKLHFTFARRVSTSDLRILLSVTAVEN